MIRKRFEDRQRKHVKETSEELDYINRLAQQRSLDLEQRKVKKRDAQLDYKEQLETQIMQRQDYGVQ